MRTSFQITSIRNRSGGWTLPELLVAVAIGALVLTAVAGFSLYSLRSFVALSNYSDLDEKSRRTVDEMTRQIRQATAIISYNTNGIKRWLTLTNSTPGAAIRYVKYTWSSQDRVLYFERTGLSAVTNLTDCDNWEFSLHMRVPIPGTTNQFYPATDKSGKIDLSLAKMVDMKWRCSREILGKAFQTESVQTTKIVLRNR
jgi:prepilin-type N-terminal cleavage/methylation domain-containing protein